MSIWSNLKVIDDCISQIETDFMPLHDVFRSLYGSNFRVPDQTQLNDTFELISFLLLNKSVITVFGPEMKPSGNTCEIDLKIIKETINSKPYEEYNYGIWFDFEENWK